MSTETGPQSIDPTQEGDFEYLVQEFTREEWPRGSIQDSEGKRKPPTPEEHERMDREVVALGTLLKDFHGWWQLDGALNVSLQSENYIGLHADVDASFVRDDIPELEKYLHERGYGLFLFTREKNESGEKIRVFRRTGSAVYHRADTTQYRIAKLGEHGKIDTRADLFRIDVQVLERNDEGELITPRIGVPLPARWLDGKTIDFKGVPIRCSSPARFIFFKLFFDRGYDMDDLEHFIQTGAVAVQDLEEVHTMIDASGKAREDLKPFIPEAKQKIQKMRKLLEEYQKD